MGAVVEAVAGCRLVEAAAAPSDPASEEAVMARVPQVLVACVSGRAAPALAGRHVFAAVTACFRVVRLAGARGELLQRVSRQTMQEVVRCVFARLPHLRAAQVAGGEELSQRMEEGGRRHGRMLGMSKSSREQKEGARRGEEEE